MSADIINNTPILVGSGQTVIRQIDALEEVKSPVELAAQALQLALDDTRCPQINAAVDTLAMTRTFIDSAGVLEHPFGTSKKPPRSVANLLGLTPGRVIYGEEGGQSPQRLVNEFAEAIFKGEAELVALCGAEATAAMKTALRQGWSLDWNDAPDGKIEDRGFKPLFTDLERQHHITYPPQVYALFENAWRHERKLSVAAHRKLMGRLFARFSEIAAANPYAQFPVARSEEFLATVSDENYAFNEPYHKWMVAQDAVNQAAAVILTSVGKARELGIAEDRWVYLHGYADANDTYVSRRVGLSSSIAMKAACGEALAMADKTIDDIRLLDLYSCFPIAVLAACDAMGIDWQDERDLTVTGGLPFFGGAGNNYSLHAIAEMHQRLWANPGEFGLVTANGGYLSKQSVGIYSTTPATNWEPRKGNPAQETVDVYPTETVLYPFDGKARIESYSLVYKKSVPAVGFAVCWDEASDQRVLAKVERGDETTMQALIDVEPIGRQVSVHTTEKGAYFTFT
jgi:acetyl-CoA C-acetyltransferase